MRRIDLCATRLIADPLIPFHSSHCDIVIEHIFAPEQTNPEQTGPEHATPGGKAQFSTRLSFLFIGVALAAWAPLVPYAKARAGLDDGSLGLLLLCLGAGSLVAMPLSGALSTRFGCRAVIVAAGILVCIALPLLSYVTAAPLLAGALFLFGAAIGTADVAVNIQAVIVEKAAHRPMMSGFHGLFSVGGMVGAGGVSGLIWLGFAPFGASLIAAAFLGLLLLLAGPYLLAYGNVGGERTPLFVAPHGMVLFIGILCFIIFLAEGAMLDWGALFLIQARGFDRETAGIGYAAFALAMTIGRLSGDRIVAALGGRRVLLFGGLCVVAGFLLAVLVPNGYLSLLGFALIGLGASNIVPVLYTATGRQKAMSPSHAIAAITTIGYAGILVGPAFIGFVADWTSLNLAFILVGLLVLSIAASSRIVTNPKA